MLIHLDEDIFEVVKNGTKKVEMRLYDEKRQKLKKGDIITFLKRPDDKEKINAVIENLSYYDRFEDLINDYPIEELYLKNYSKDDLLNLLRRFYSEEDEKIYGTVAISFKKI